MPRSGLTADHEFPPRRRDKGNKGRRRGGRGGGGSSFFCGNVGFVALFFRQRQAIQNGRTGSTFPAWGMAPPTATQLTRGRSRVDPLPWSTHFCHPRRTRKDVCSLCPPQYSTIQPFIPIAIKLSAEMSDSASNFIAAGSCHASELLGN